MLLDKRNIRWCLYIVEQIVGCACDAPLRLATDRPVEFYLQANQGRVARGHRREARVLIDDRETLDEGISRTSNDVAMHEVYVLICGIVKKTILEFILKLR